MHDDAEKMAERFFEDVVHGPMWDKCRDMQTLDEFLGLEDGGVALCESEWGQLESRSDNDDAIHLPKAAPQSDGVRLPRGLATAAAVRFGLRPGCLIRDAIDALQDDRRLEGTVHPDGYLFRIVEWFSHTKR